MDVNSVIGNHRFPIRTIGGDYYAGKVRDVYWLSAVDSARLIQQREYNVPEDITLGAMITTDRVSAFDVNWEGEGGIKGTRGKGAALNAMSEYFFRRLGEEGIESHFLESIHPNVWIVRKAKPVYLEGIVRNYLAGSMWRAYQKGEREFFGQEVPDGMQEYDQFGKPLFTPTTKGIMEGLEDYGIAARDDAKIPERRAIIENLGRFGLDSETSLDQLIALSENATSTISQVYESIGRAFIDHKMEFGWFRSIDGRYVLGLMDEVGTCDSSRVVTLESLRAGKPAEESKEPLRQYLVEQFGEEIIHSKEIAERCAENDWIPASVLEEKVSKPYIELAQELRGEKISVPKRPVEEIHDVLNDLGVLQ